MIINYTFKDIASSIKKLNKDSWLVKICVVVTTRHIICVDTDNEVEFFRYPVENVNAFYNKLYILRQAMYHFDYKGCGKIRPKVTKKYSNKLLTLWKKANEIKSSKLLSTQS